MVLRGRGKVTWSHVEVRDHLENKSPCGKTGLAGNAGERALARDGLLHGNPGSFDPGSAGCIRDLLASRFLIRKGLQREAYPRHQPGDLLYRKKQHIDGPLFLGMDTHALSVPAIASALEVLAANEVEVMMLEKGRIYSDAGDIPCHSHLQPRTQRQGLPTASSSRHRTIRRMTAASNTIPPMAAGRIGRSPRGSKGRRMSFSKQDYTGVKRIPYEKALAASTTHRHDYLNAYIADLKSVIDMDTIAGAEIRLGVDPLAAPGCTTGGRLPSATELI